MQVRLASGAVALVVGLSLSACDGDEAPAGGGASSPVPVPAGPEVQITPALFSAEGQNQVQQLDCAGAMTATDIDSAGPTDAKPLKNPDLETDGLAAIARANRTGLEIEGGKSPAPRYLFPREPAASRRAVVQFVAPSGRIVAVFISTRDVPRGPWRATSILECA